MFDSSIALRSSLSCMRFERWTLNTARGDASGQTAWPLGSGERASASESTLNPFDLRSGQAVGLSPIYETRDLSRQL
jgi:hypothetical protein